MESVAQWVVYLTRHRSVVDPVKGLVTVVSLTKKLLHSLLMLSTVWFQELIRV